MKTTLGMLVLGLAVAGFGVASACAPAPPLNKPVQIADESAIIIWDANSKTQHFIRRASFTTQATDFGFLVPTPTQPTLAEADDEVFATLAKLTAPEVITKSRPSNLSCGCGMEQDKSAGAVRVLEEKRVGGYDAVVLEADDATALSKWLKDHGYEFGPNLAEWAKHYIQAGWKISAFKIAKDAAEQDRVATSAVRMTCQTDKPFFPYREPAAATGTDTAAGPRLLRVFFIGAAKAKGVLGDQQAWPGTVVWAGKVAAADRDKALQQLKLPAESAPGSWWLTEFEDHSSPRPGSADVTFAAADDQDPVKRPPYIKYVAAPLPTDITGYALAAALVIPVAARRWRRRSDQTSA